MENQGKRLLLAVGLALLVILTWNMIFPPDKPEPQKGSGSGSGSAAVAVVEAPPPPGIMPTAGGPAKPDTRPPEELITLPFDRFTASFSSYGGSLKSWKLADPRFGRDATGGQLLPDRTDTGAFLVCVLDAECDLTRPEVWRGQKLSETSVQYTHESPRFDIVKTFTIFPDDYLVKLNVTVKAKQDIPAQQRIAIVSYAKQDPKADDGGSRQVAARVWQSSTRRDGSIYHTPIKEVVKSPRWEDNVQWTGFEHPYLLAGYAPLHAETDRIEKKTWAGPILGPGEDDLVRTDILFPPVLIKAGNQVAHEIVGYLGPKNYRELERADSAAGFSTGFTQTIDFGWFGVIGRPLLWLLLKFYAVVGNWGIAIIMLTFLVKLATLYWTTKSMRSMKAMAALAPQMKLLQEKYKDDRQRLQVETMALYKQHNVNPIAGCLPILLQMPIWIALYRMLSSAGELYQAPFIHGWIDDLTNTDPYHILPIVLVVTMFVQARLQPATGDSRQQKFLQYGMPLMFGVMSFFFPSGLTIYIFTNTVLSALHSIYMNKYDKKSLALVAQMKKNAEAAAAAKAGTAGKGGGGGAKGTAKNGKPAKPIIDVTSTEAAADDGEGDESPATGASSPATPSRAGAARPKRNKKRRR